MSGHRARVRAKRSQKIIAVVLFICMIAMGSATFLAASNLSRTPLPPATGQSL